MFYNRCASRYCTIEYLHTLPYSSRHAPHPSTVTRRRCAHRGIKAVVSACYPVPNPPRAKPYLIAKAQASPNPGLPEPVICYSQRKMRLDSLTGPSPCSIRKYQSKSKRPSSSDNGPRRTLMRINLRQYTYGASC